MTGFDRRAYMLDVSRDRVPTRATLEWLVGVLAAAGFNELQLYVEHTFTYRNHDVVWRDASPLTHDDLRWLDGLAAEQGIDLVANMNGFGHMGRWLIHDDYRSRAECPDGFAHPFSGDHSPPTCLEPTAENAALAVALARDIAGCVRHPRIHVGGDEPFELGQGASSAAVAERGRDRVYLDHLAAIIEPLVDEGREVLFWADLFRRDRSLMPDIPSGATGVVWNYSAPSDQGWEQFLSAEQIDLLGLPEDANRGFVAHARLFIESETPFWVAPGTSTWNTIIGMNENAAANIDDAVAVGLAHGADGLLLTDWGDGGHWQPLPVSLPSIVRAGEAASTGTLPDEAVVAARVDEICGFDSGTGELIDRLGCLGARLGLMTPNGSPLFSSLNTSGFPALGSPDPAGFLEVEQALADAAETLAVGSVGGPRGDVVAQELGAAVGLASLGLRELARDKEVELGGGVPDPPSAEVRAEVVEAQRAAWLRSSRPGGLDDSIAKLRA